VFSAAVAVTNFRLAVMSHVIPAVKINQKIFSVNSIPSCANVGHAS